MGSLAENPGCCTVGCCTAGCTALYCSEAVSCCMYRTVYKEGLLVSPASLVPDLLSLIHRTPLTGTPLLPPAEDSLSFLRSSEKSSLIWADMTGDDEDFLPVFWRDLERLGRRSGGGSHSTQTCWTSWTTCLCPRKEPPYPPKVRHCLIREIIGCLNWRS